MRILFYCLNYYPEATGSGKYNGELAEWLAARGSQIDVITGVPHYPNWVVEPKYRSALFMTEQLNGVRIMRARHYVPPQEKLDANRRILLETTFSIFSLRYWLPRWLEREKYDIVLVVSPPMQVGMLPLIYSGLRNVPWVFHIQDLQVEAAVRLGILKGRLYSILYQIEAFLLRHATRVSTISEAMRRRLIQKGVDASRAWLFPNWSDISFVRPLPHNNNFRRELEIGDHEVLIMYAGNMGEKQGLELVIQAADRLRREQQIKFVLVGAGAARSRLERLAEDLRLQNVLFLPVQPLGRLPEMLASADIHLVVQRREAADLVMPSKLTNILAAGRPSIATADPGTALYQILAEHASGIVTPPEDLGAFVEAVRRLSRDAGMRREMGNNARVYAELYLDKEKILSDFEDKLIQLVEDERRSR